MSVRQARKKLAKPQRVCAVHQSGGELRAVAAGLNGGPTVLGAAALRDTSEVEAFAKEHKADLIVGVAPSGSTICRVMPLPADATVETIDLLVETQFEDSIPAHRRAGGIFPGLSEGEPRAALLTAWARGDEQPTPDQLQADCWVCEVAAVAMLGPGVSVATDRGQESVAIAATGGHKALARVFRGDGSSDQAWRQTVCEAVDETASAAGLRTPDLGAGRDSVVLPGSPVSDRASGARSEVGWVKQYGVALGAALIALDEDDRIRSLLRDAPDSAVSPMEAAAFWLADRRHAGAVIATCLALMLLIPLGVAWGRTLVLESRVQQLREQEAQWRDMSDRAEVYRILTEQRWPMTKLLADLSRLTPVGVEVEQITISPEQGVVLRGSAESAEKMNEFSRNLNSSGVFGLAMPGRQDETRGAGVQFDLTASVVNPHAQLKDAEDFAERTLAVRLHGERGENTLYRGEGTSRATGRSRPDRPDRGVRSERSGEASESASPSSGEIPPPLRKDALDAMSRIEVMRSLPRWRQAVRNAPDESTKARLEEELRMIQAKLSELQGGGE